MSAVLCHQAESFVRHYVVKNCVDTKILHPHLIDEYTIPAARAWLHGSAPIQPEDLELQMRPKNGPFYSKTNMCMFRRCDAWSRGASGSQMPRRPWRPARPPTTTTRRSPDNWRERTRSYRRSSRRSAGCLLSETPFLIPSFLSCLPVKGLLGF